MAAVKTRLLNVLIAIDQLGYTLLTLGRGSPDETMSAAAWRLERDGHVSGRVFRPLIDAVLFFDHDHCRKAFDAELSRSQLPDRYRRA